MKIFFISCLLLSAISISNIHYCNQRRRVFERAAIYRSEVICLILGIWGFLQIPSAILLGIMNWKILIGVYIFFIFMRLYINLFFEEFFIFPFGFFLLRVGRGKKSRNRSNDET